MRKFHRDERGQLTFLVIVGAVVFAALLGMVTTTGDQVARKVRIQNAADAGALSGGAWMARGLNVTSAINVIQSQLVAGALLLDAFARTIHFASLAMPGMIAGWCACAATGIGCPVCCPVCALLTFQRPLLSILSPALDAVANTLARCPGGLMWKAASALGTLNGGLQGAVYPVAVTASANLVRDILGNQGEAWDTNAIFLPGRRAHNLSDFFKLPTSAAGPDALCDPMIHGSPSERERGYHPLLDYPVNQGPLLLGQCRISNVAAFMTGFPPVSTVVFPALVEARRAALCGGTIPPHQTYERRVKNLDECEQVGGRAAWRRTSLVTVGVGRDPCTWFADTFDNRREPSTAHPNVLEMDTRNAPDRSCSWRPPGTRKLREFQYCKVVGSAAGREGTEKEIEVWTALAEATIEKEIDDESFDGGNVASPCGEIRPYVLERGDPDALRYLMFVRQKNRRPFFSGRFQEDPPGMFAYAQVEVYNGISEDTFTQDWRVRLERATLLDSAFERIESGPLMDKVIEPLLHRAGFDELSFTDSMRLVNNH